MKCPVCNKDLSDECRVCPRCKKCLKTPPGYEVTEEGEPAYVKRQEELLGKELTERKKNFFEKNPKLISAGIIVLGIILCLIVKFM